MIQDRCFKMCECCLFFICRFWKVFFVLCLGVEHIAATAAVSCTFNLSPLISNVKDIACATKGLRTAVQKDDLLRKMSKTNYFLSMNPQDVQRSIESLTFFNRSLTNRIKDVHKRYQVSGVDHYTLNIATYPSNVKKNACLQHKTIDFDSYKAKSEFPDYSIVSGKESRVFQIGIYGKKPVICERTKMSKAERLKAFCGEPVAKCDDIVGEEELPDCSVYNSCKKSLPPSCSDSKIDDKNKNDICIPLKKAEGLLQDLLMSTNASLDKEYCPVGCSYYTQTVQRVYKGVQTKSNRRKSSRRRPSNNYCSDSYLIVHCGPGKSDSSYNLNIREITNLCSDSPSCR